MSMKNNDELSLVERLENSHLFSGIEFRAFGNEAGQRIRTLELRIEELEKEIEELWSK